MVFYNKTCCMKCKKQKIEKNKNISTVAIKGTKNQVDQNTNINRAFNSFASKNVCHDGRHLEILVYQGLCLHCRSGGTCCT